MTDTINTRELIMNILLEMDREKTPCHLAVRDALDKYQFLPRQDRAFIKRVCEGTVEYGIQNDYIINQYSKIKINKCKPVIRAILRMSVYQIRFLDAVPDSAVVNEAVKLAEKKHFYNLKGFVNGVLRTIVREKDHLPMPKENNTTQYLSVKYSMPEFLVEEFVSQYGKETAETMMADFLKEKQVTIRINRWNNTIEETKKSLESQGAELEKAPYLGEAFYLKNFETIASLNAFQEGRFQIQDVSSMMAAHLADPKPGDQVLDLCAAPGGKSTQIGAALNGEGLLISNEIHPARAKILSENIERMGIRNAIVTNETPEHLSEIFVEYFDRILVDAPCSGEGMFRKNEDAMTEWSKENVTLCAERQDGILSHAASMLRPGGRLVYSTCTFAPEENEGSISRFLEKYPEFSIEAVEKKDGMSAGVPEWISRPADGIGHTIRLWPHRLKGEGHYLAVLKKAGELPDDYRGGCRNGEQTGLKEKDCKECMEFLDTYFKKKPMGILVKFGDQIYLAPEGSPSLKGLKVLRPGLHLGTVKKNRFEPSHALALASKVSDVTYSTDLPSDGAEIRAYLNGQTINREGEKGWYLITTDGYSIGWGKLAGGIMKNHYPKGLRKNW